MKLFDEKKYVNFTKEPIFFGEARNLQRYDQYKYPFFYKQGEKMDSQFWKPAEINLSQDVKDFKNLLPHEERIATLNIKRQEVLDSVQGRSLLATFGRVTTLPELEYCLTRVQYQETNHSDTYAFILRAIYDNSSKVFDEILDDEVIARHSGYIVEHYEVVYDLINKWESYPNYQNESNKRKLKKAIYLALISWNILEGIRFYVSFACTFAFAENKKLEGIAKELRLIARDENVHLAISQRIINILRKEEDEGFLDIVEECEDEVIKMYMDASRDEIEWAEKLFEEGSIIGLNAEILTMYMKSLINKRMKAIGLSKQFDNVDINPLPWMSAWLGNEQIEERAQETQLASYLIGSVKDDW